MNYHKIKPKHLTLVAEEVKLHAQETHRLAEGVRG